jgi:hypothetical protein
MRLKNCIDYKCFPEPPRGDWTRFTILVLSAKTRKAALRASAGLFWYAADWELAHRTKYAETARATVRSWTAFLSLQAPLEGHRDSDGRQAGGISLSPQKDNGAHSGRRFSFYP